MHGSLIQQNFGEDTEKGFLFWDIQDKDNFNATSHFLKGSRKFYTVKLNQDLSIPNITNIEKDSRIRVDIPRTSLTHFEYEELKRIISKKFDAFEVVVPPSKILPEKQDKKSTSEKLNLRDLNVQENLLKDFLKDIDEDVFEKIKKINKDADEYVEKKEEVRNVTWKLDKVVWDNLFQYGEDNHIVFDNLRGITGIFAQNASGKSNLIESINYSLFNKNTLGVPRAVYLINDDKQSSRSAITFIVNDKRFVVERTLDRIKKKKREESKGTCKFYVVEDGNSVEECVDEGSESGIDRSETDKKIQQRIGTFDDFCLTSLYAQNNPLDLVSCKEGKRKEVLYKFQDLDIFEEKREIAKDKFKFWKNKLKELNQNSIFEDKQNAETSLAKLNEEKNKINSNAEFIKLVIEESTLVINDLNIQRNRLNFSDVEPDLDRFNELDEQIKELNESIFIKELKAINIPIIHQEITNEKVEEARKELSKKEQELVRSKSENDSIIRKTSLLKQVPCRRSISKM